MFLGSKGAENLPRWGRTQGADHRSSYAAETASNLEGECIRRLLELTRTLSCRLLPSDESTARQRRCPVTLGWIGEMAGGGEERRFAASLAAVAVEASRAKPWTLIYFEPAIEPVDRFKFGSAIKYKNFQFWTWFTSGLSSMRTQADSIWTLNF